MFPKFDLYQNKFSSIQSILNFARRTSTDCRKVLGSLVTLDWYVFSVAFVRWDWEHFSEEFLEMTTHNQTIG